MAPPPMPAGSTAAETREIRVYLHGGNDTALVTGDVDTSIPVRIIGGNGSNCCSTRHASPAPPGRRTSTMKAR